MIIQHISPPVFLMRCQRNATVEPEKCEVSDNAISRLSSITHCKENHLKVLLQKYFKIIKQCEIKEFCGQTCSENT